MSGQQEVECANCSIILRTGNMTDVPTDELCSECEKTIDQEIDADFDKLMYKILGITVVPDADEPGRKEIEDIILDYISRFDLKRLRLVAKICEVNIYHNKKRKPKHELASEVMLRIPKITYDKLKRISPLCSWFKTQAH